MLLRGIYTIHLCGDDGAYRDLVGHLHVANLDALGIESCADLGASRGRQGCAPKSNLGLNSQYTNWLDHSLALSPLAPAHRRRLQLHPRKILQGHGRFVLLRGSEALVFAHCMSNLSSCLGGRGGYRLENNTAGKCDAQGIWSTFSRLEDRCRLGCVGAVLRSLLRLTLPFLQKISLTY